MRLRTVHSAVVLTLLASPMHPAYAASTPVRARAHVMASRALAAHPVSAGQGFSDKTAAINDQHSATLKSWIVGDTRVENLTATFDVVDPFFDRLGILTLQKVKGRSVYSIGTYPGASRRLAASALVTIVRAAQASQDLVKDAEDGDLRQAEGLEALPFCVVEFDRQGVLTSIVWP